MSSCVANHTPGLLFMYWTSRSSIAIRDRWPDEVRVHREHVEAALVVGDVELRLEHLEHVLR